MEIIFTDLETQETLVVQYVPEKLNYDPDSSIMAIATYGRNNPRYHFTGSEDTLTFRLDWHAEEEARNDVIRKCRWLESKTKNDGYVKGLPRIQFGFGDLFGFEEVWLITNAKYELSLFDRPVGMLPKQAYQDITMKRITTSNRTTEEIKKYTR